MKQDRIILAEDHPNFRDRLRQLAHRLVPGATIEEAGSFSELLSMTRSGPLPSTIITDLIFAGESVRPKLGTLRQEFERTSIIVVSMVEGTGTAEQIMAQGLTSFISKSVPPSALSAIASVRDGEDVIRLETPDNPTMASADASILLTPRPGPGRA